MAGFKYISIPLNIEDDSDLIESIEQFKAQGGNLSDLIRNLLREYFFGPQIDDISDKALYKLIQLEKRQEEAFKKLEELTEFLNELSLELANLRKTIEQKQKEVEVRKQEEVEKKEAEIKGLIKQKFEWYAECARYGGLTPEQKFKLIKDVERFAEEHGLTFEEVVTTILGFYPSLEAYLNGRWAKWI